MGAINITFQEVGQAPTFETLSAGESALIQALVDAGGERYGGTPDPDRPGRSLPGTGQKTIWLHELVTQALLNNADSVAEDAFPDVGAAFEQAKALKLQRLNEALGGGR